MLDTSLALMKARIETPPSAGQGVNNWLFRAARRLHRHYHAEEIRVILRDSVAGCGRGVPQREIDRAVMNSTGLTLMRSSSRCKASKSPAWPAVNEEQRVAVVRDFGGLIDLWEASPMRLEDDEAHTEMIIDRLFPGNPLLCVGESQQNFRTLPREHLRGVLAGLSFIVPSPMTAVVGMTKEGRLSEHTLEKTGPRRFLVVEFDGGSLDEQAALLLHLAQQAPLAVALHSGSKSLHGWFYCAHVSESRARSFMHTAVELGADRATWTRSQFVRMPDGQRDNGNRQTVYFFNPAVVKS